MSDLEIKVSVEYNKPISQLDALMEEYYAAQKVLDNTRQELNPLIEASGKAKFDAIMEQMKTVFEYLEQECIITGRSPIQHTAFYDNGTYGRFVIKYWRTDNTWRIYFNCSSGNDSRMDFDWNPDKKEQHKELLDFLSHNYSEKVVADLIRDITANIRLHTRLLIDKAKSIENTLKGIKGGE